MLVEVAIRGLAPLICHNEQLADPLNEWVRALKVYTAKRKKTDRDHEEIGRLEFMGGLYLDEQKLPCIPGEHFEAMLISEAGRNRMKRQAQAGIICDGLFPILYEGPADPEKLWAQRPQFVLRKGIRAQNARVMRTRPMFRKWGLNFTMDILEEEIDQGTVADLLYAAGRHTGLGDWRPKFGRFVVEKIKELKS